MKFLAKKINIILFLLIIICIETKVFARDSKIQYTRENIANYFLGIISTSQDYNVEAFQYLKKVKSIEKQHSQFNIEFARTLVLLEKFKQAFEYSKNVWNEENLYFEIDLLLGLNLQEKGSILLDDVPLSEYNLESYRQRVGYVPQDAVLFNMSVRDNLLFANPRATEEELWKACSRANANEFVKQLPEKLETIIGDRGIRLSGGQCQRIALARALVRKPELLILDEATSALDTKSEQLIQQAIDRIAGETTIVVVAHRLSTIANADYVYVLQEGRVTEEGEHTELLARKGVFFEMVKTQQTPELTTNL